MLKLELEMKKFRQPDGEWKVLNNQYSVNDYKFKEELFGLIEDIPKGKKREFLRETRDERTEERKAKRKKQTKQRGYINENL